MKHFVSFLLLAIFLHGCSQSNKSKVLWVRPGYENLTPEQMTALVEKEQVERKKRETTGYTNTEIEEMLMDKTVLFASGKPLNQIEYYARDGSAYLWYPGNTKSVKSKWYIEENKRICFIYPQNSYDPVAKTFGGKPECKSVAFWKSNSIAHKAGDIFSLSSGNIPYVMNPRTMYVDLDEVQQNKGRDIFSK